MKSRARYQNGSITREARMHDSDVWVLRWREMNPDGSWIRRKSVIGTVKEHPSRAAAYWHRLSFPDWLRYLHFHEIKRLVVQS
ncbi:MAG: hypothetical protein WB660_02555 [Candidatus Sulfotelmatobacter sp.]